MNIVPPTTYQQYQQYQQPQFMPERKRRIWPIIVIVVLLALLTFNYVRPLPAATATLTVTGLNASGKPVIPWPTDGQAAVAAPDYGILGTHGDQKPLATASIAKVILALCVLDKQPLKAGAAGPTYTVNADDVATYNNYVAKNGSVTLVQQGEKLTEYQALQALMLPSANNVADSMARWVFGSQATYAAYATNYLLNHHINQTAVGTDASGFDPSTTSTASDLTQIGLLALKNPVLTAITTQKSVILPVAGLVANYNTVLGVNGINGIKTGNNDQDPGAFLFSAKLKVGDKQVPVTGAVMGAADLPTALQSATRLSAAMQQGFEEVTVAKAGQQLGVMRTAWGASQPIVTAKKVAVVHWQNTAIGETHTVRTNLRQGVVGSLQVSAPGSKGQTDLQLKNALAAPSFWWRLSRL
jgi:D-alanyl-D-alanine carboxypeptidase (penicillin-binding protein 5/6)